MFGEYLAVRGRRERGEEGGEGVYFDLLVEQLGADLVQGALRVEIVLRFTVETLAVLGHKEYER